MQDTIITVDEQKGALLSTHAEPVESNLAVSERENNARLSLLGINIITVCTAFTANLFISNDHQSALYGRMTKTLEDIKRNAFYEFKDEYDRCMIDQCRHDVQVKMDVAIDTQFKPVEAQYFKDVSKDNTLTNSLTIISTAAAVIGIVGIMSKKCCDVSEKKIRAAKLAEGLIYISLIAVGNIYKRQIPADMMSIVAITSLAEATFGSRKIAQFFHHLPSNIRNLCRRQQIASI